VSRPTLLGIPYDASSSFLRGAAAAPPVIRAAFRSDASNLWTEELVDLGVEGCFGDAGDLSPADLTRDAMTGAVAGLVRDGARPLVLGGDHSITYPVVRAVARSTRPLSILHFDAHNDLYEDFGGDRYSHACPFARVLEEGLCAQLVQVGIRAMTGPQYTQAQRYGVDVIDMRRWVAGDRWQLRHPVYISVDVDVLDPGGAPAVSHREAGGMSSRDLLSALQRIEVPIVGADLVEFNPSRDTGDLTARVCAKLLKELLGAMVRRSP
jgi:agmatinase